VRKTRAPRRLVSPAIGWAVRRPTGDDARMDVDATPAEVRRRYEGWLTEHGPESSRAVGWVDPDLEAVRFDVLARLVYGDR
jgi:hypothetical protein